MFRPPLLETLRTKEKEPLLAEPSAKKEPAKASTNSAISGLCNDVLIHELSQYLSYADLGALAQTSRDVNNAVKKVPVNNSFKLFGNISEAYTNAKQIENFETLKSWAPVFIGAFIPLSPIGAVLPAFIEVYKKMEHAKNEALIFFSRAQPVTKELVNKVAHAQYLDRSIFHKLIEFDKIHPQFFTLDNLMLGAVFLLMPIINFQQANAFFNHWRTAFEQTFAQFDQEIAEYKNTTTTFNTLSR